MGGSALLVSGRTRHSAMSGPEERQGQAVEWLTGVVVAAAVVTSCSGRTGGLADAPSPSDAGAKEACSAPETGRICFDGHFPNHNTRVSTCLARRASCEPPRKDEVSLQADGTLRIGASWWEGCIGFERIWSAWKPRPHSPNDYVAFASLDIINCCEHDLILTPLSTARTVHALDGSSGPFVVPTGYGQTAVSFLTRDGAERFVCPDSGSSSPQLKPPGADALIDASSFRLRQVRIRPGTRQEWIEPFEDFHVDVSEDFVAARFYRLPAAQSASARPLLPPLAVACGLDLDLSQFEPGCFRSDMSEYPYHEVSFSDAPVFREGLSDLLERLQNP